MTVTTSYPGVYIQELPSLVHTIRPAPTSIAVFVGYTHQFLTKGFQKNPSDPTPAIQLFSFADYQANFGGFFYSPWLPDYVGQAVYQFFLNGGPSCYVVGLPAQQYQQGSAATAPPASVVPVPATALFGDSTDNITFTALQPVGIPAPAAASSAPASSAPASSATDTSATDASATDTSAKGGSAKGSSTSSSSTSSSSTGTVGIPMYVSFSNPQPKGTPTTFDIVISYATMVETYRNVSIGNLQTTSNLQNGIAPSSDALPAMLQNSALVAVQVTGNPTVPSILAQATTSFTYGDNPPMAGWTLINPPDFAPVFANYASLDKVPIFNLLATPGMADSSVISEAVAYCERKRAFYIMDTPPPSLQVPLQIPPPAVAAPPAPAASPVADGTWGVDNLINDVGTTLSASYPVSTNAALYYPWLVTTDPVTGAPSTAPPSGFVAGMYGQEDNMRGVWKSPAGIETALNGTTGVDPNGVMNDPQQGVFNQSALNCLRQFQGIGTVIYGARTTAGADINTAQQQWKYVAVRRMALFIEQTLYANLTWAVFEGNSTPLWNALTQEVTAFMLSLFRQNAFAGDTPSQAFVVQCDATTTTPTDVANGTVNILVGFAPLVPAEFVVVKIAQLAGQAQS